MSKDFTVSSVFIAVIPIIRISYVCLKGDSGMFDKRYSCFCRVKCKNHCRHVKITVLAYGPVCFVLRQSICL